MYFKLHSAREGRTLIRKLLNRINHNVSDSALNYFRQPHFLLPPSFFKEVKHKCGICIQTKMGKFLFFAVVMSYISLNALRAWQCETCISLNTFRAWQCETAVSCEVQRSAVPTPMQCGPVTGDKSKGEKPYCPQ